MVAKPRFWCLFPGCHGAAADGSDLFQHAEQHLGNSLPHDPVQAQRDMERWAGKLGFKPVRRE